MTAHDASYIPLIRSLKILDDGSVEVRSEHGLQIQYITRDGLYDDRHAYDTAIGNVVPLPGARAADQLRFKPGEGCNVGSHAVVMLRLLAVEAGRAVFASTVADHAPPKDDVIRVAPYDRSE
jgi:hypothetical protein